MKRYDDMPLPYSQGGPMPTRRPTIRVTGGNSAGGGGGMGMGGGGTIGRGTGGTVKRSKTLTRPERHVAPEPLINPAGKEEAVAHASGSKLDWWTLTSWVVTFWAPSPLLKMVGITEASSRQAWREKITLCFIAIIMGGIVGFATMGLQSALCPGGSNGAGYQLLGTRDSTLSIGGWAFNINESKPFGNVNFYELSNQMTGQDITPFFTRTAADYPDCTATNFRYAAPDICNAKAKEGNECLLEQLNANSLASYALKNESQYEGYSWLQVVNSTNYIVIDGWVLNMNPYMRANPQPISGDPIDAVIRRAITIQSSSGKDLTKQFYNNPDTKAAIKCLTTRYLAGKIDKTTPGCFVAALFLYASLIVILAVVLVRFFMAIIFSWFISHRLIEKKTLSRGTGIAPTVMPEGANVSVHNQTGTAPWAQPGRKGQAPAATAAPVMSLDRIGSELFCVCLVTCYSEGEEGIRNTLDSIAGTSYPDQRKLLWVVCDGMITGAGEAQSTPDICVGMLEADPRFGNPQPMGYIAVGSGAKRENRAMVYAGHYVTKDGHRAPTVIVVKCGVPSEANDKKPGNRGKRDSQLILMNFFSRVTYNDRMTPLDYDLFRKVQTLMGVTPDFFEVCLMVDADTKVYPDSLAYLVNAMANDNMVMGVCGETRIANKRQSWVTAIQVWEYYISHHQMKAFESVFGGVTCLPGCFSMYRIKARKDTENDWVPILVKPEIVREYIQSDVVTLHQKNLLLLGEDRFLSTILLRTFPNRRNIFLPQARCRTIAPDTFSVLLSQRRRWINSTIHNLMELVLVRDLCGTFCFSMQFVVFMDLVGTIVLPIAICLTFALVVNSILKPPQKFEEAIPLMLLACILGLPAFLILITTRKLIYVAWMLVYLCALPVWNFILPVYSFWHFDDFSWGETRKVEGEVVDKAGHSDATAVFDGTTIPLRRWDDWERSRLRKIRREEKRRRQMERMHGQAFYGDDEGMLVAPDRGFARDESDNQSIVSSEEDAWGGDVGGYDENHPSFPPPPMSLPPESRPMPGPSIGMDQMAQMLDQGFEEPPPANVRYDRRTPSPLHRPRVSPPADQYSGQYAGVGQGRGPTHGRGESTSIEQYVNGHVRQRSAGGQNGYGPLGPA
ncbi:hypothetical protein CspHIS471_0410490 [Cutaneotrichosporon sp. HIS471]|nr:hypothetical protein CspHIS471_0410490 [Cutaneotrichosporon sp. HIS471]